VPRASCAAPAPGPILHPPYFHNYLRCPLAPQFTDCACMSAMALYDQQKYRNMYPSLEDRCALVHRWGVCSGVKTDLNCALLGDEESLPRPASSEILPRPASSEQLPNRQV
jgi:hypothetical protein